MENKSLENLKTSSRDSHGRFVKKGKVNIKDEPPILDNSGKAINAATIITKTTISTPKTVPNKPDFEKPLVAVILNNPFKRLLYWLDEIRRKQTTTFAIKLSIPLIAIPIIIAGIFSLGKISGTYLEKEKAASPIPLATPLPSATLPPIDPKTDPIVSKAGTLRFATSSETKNLLALRNGTLIVLDVPPTIDLSNYKEKQVLITGTYNNISNVFKVIDIAEVQTYNSTSTPQASSSAQ